MIFVVKTDGEPLALKEAARQLVRAVAPNAGLSIRSFDEVIAWASAPRIFNLRLLGFFSATAVLLAAIGLYAITSQAVTARTREIGIRMALGANRRRIAREVLGGSAVIVAIGIGMGLALAALLAPLGAAMLYNVRAFDPITYVVIAGTLGAVALLASWLPARRATQVDPIIALRSE
jgi:putative ABC transport system permease protein